MIYVRCPLCGFQSPRRLPIPADGVVTVGSHGSLGWFCPGGTVVVKKGQGKK